MPPDPWIWNVLPFLMPIPNRVASNVPTLPFSKFTIATKASSTARFGAKVRVTAMPSLTGPFR